MAEDTGASVPLLSASAARDDCRQAGADEEVCAGPSAREAPVLRDSSPPLSVLEEFWDIAAIATPTAIGNLFEFLPVTSALALVGNLHGSDRKLGLAALSLGRAYFNITVLAPVLGMLGPLRTLCPQALGSGQPQALAVYAQQSLLVVLAMAIPCISLQLTAANVLVVAGQDRELAALAQQYCVRSIPVYFGLASMTILQRVYQAHKMVWSNLIICGLAFVVALPVQVLMINVWGMGFRGAAWASSFSYCSFVFIQVAHLVAIGMGSLFQPRLREALSWGSMKAFVSLALPALSQTMLEYGAMEAMVVVSGMLRPASRSLAASSIAINLMDIMYMGWVGVLVALAVSVGRYIGAGKVHAAKRAAIAGGAAAAILGAVAGFAIVCFRSPISRFFSPEEELQHLSCDLLKIAGLVVFLDAVGSALGGIMCGLGMQRAMALCQLVGYYMVGLPAGTTAAFTAYHGREGGVAALWLGVALSILACVGLQGGCVLLHAWTLSVRDASERLSSHVFN